MKKFNKESFFSRTRIKVSWLEWARNWSNLFHLSDINDFVNSLLNFSTDIGLNSSFKFKTTEKLTTLILSKFPLFYFDDIILSFMVEKSKTKTEKISNTFTSTVFENFGIPIKNENNKLSFSGVVESIIQPKPEARTLYGLNVLEMLLSVSFDDVKGYFNNLKIFKDFDMKSLLNNPSDLTFSHVFCLFLNFFTTIKVNYSNKFISLFKNFNFFNCLTSFILRPFFGFENFHHVFKNNRRVVFSMTQVGYKLQNMYRFLSKTQRHYSNFVFKNSNYLYRLFNSITSSKLGVFSLLFFWKKEVQKNNDNNASNVLQKLLTRFKWSIKKLLISDDKLCFEHIKHVRFYFHAFEFNIFSVLPSLHGPVSLIKLMDTTKLPSNTKLE